jgi:F0F1-type ATP synthase epsilon subunit
MADQPVDSAVVNAPDASELVADKPKVTVKVYAPFKVYFEGEAHALSAVNEVGPFDILPGHRNFLCMLVPCNLAVHTPSGKQNIKISRALMHVKANHITVFVDV